jgi:hypothetical protein
MRVEFNEMPPDARLWIFAAERPLTEGETDALMGVVDAFLDDWKAHGHPLHCARELRYELVNHAPVVYRIDNGIARDPRPAFAERARRGDVTPDTIVFNNTLTRVGELPNRWEVPARESWHARAFFKPTAVGIRD